MLVMLVFDEDVIEMAWTMMMIMMMIMMMMLLSFQWSADRHGGVPAVDRVVAVVGGGDGVADAHPVCWPLRLQ